MVAWLLSCSSLEWTKGLVASISVIIIVFTIVQCCFLPVCRVSRRVFLLIFVRSTFSVNKNTTKPLKVDYKHDNFIYFFPHLLTETRINCFFFPILSSFLTRGIKFYT